MTANWHIGELDPADLEPDLDPSGRPVQAITSTTMDFFQPLPDDEMPFTLDPEDGVKVHRWPNLLTQPLPEPQARDEEFLQRRLRQLLDAEGALDEQGIICPIKGWKDCTCSVCPFSKVGEPDHKLSPLCLVGREQERTATALCALTLCEQT